MLRESEAAGAFVEESDDEEWGGFEDTPPEPEVVDHEDEYIDEDRYTTVKVESVSVTRDGLERPKVESSDDEEKKEPEKEEKKTRPKAPKKKKFRYESKVERQLSQRKVKAKASKAKADRL